MKIKTQDLTGPALDLAVARAWYGYEYKQPIPFFNPSTSWLQGGPLIERERIALTLPRWDGHWTALRIVEEYDERWSLDGPTPLIAAMRCYVASRLGDEVDIPESLEGLA